MSFKWTGSPLEAAGGSLTVSCVKKPFSPVSALPAGQDRSHKEQLAPGVCQGLFTGLLLRGGAEAQVRSLRHPRHSQHRNPRRWLPGWGRVHPGTGRQMSPTQFEDPAVHPWQTWSVQWQTSLSAPLTSSVGSVTDECSSLLLTTPCTLLFTVMSWRLTFILIYADRCAEEDGEALVAEVWEICRQIHHHGRTVLFLKASVQAFCSDAC